MRILELTLVTLILSGSLCWSESVSITGPNRQGMLQGESYTITWEGRGVESVSIVAHGENTPLGTRSRGNFSLVIAEGVPLDQGRASWTVPWIDSTTFFIKVKGYDSEGGQITMAERGYRFRPAVVANRMEDGLYLDLSQPRNQRLYRQQDYRITRAYLSTSSENYAWRAPGSHVPTPHDHAGVFTITEKKRSHWSTLFNVEMPWAMRYHGGHFVHATSPALYGGLGAPASGGCNRLTDYDAREIYRMTPLGSRIEIIGPEG